MGEKLPAEQLQDRLARAQADVVALDARKLAARAVGKADVQPLALALGQNGQARGGVGVLFDVRQEVIRHALEHLHVGRDGAGRGQQQEVDVKAPAAQLGRGRARVGDDEEMVDIDRMFRVREVGHEPLGEHAGLAAARRRADQQRTAPVIDGGTLGRGPFCLAHWSSSFFSSGSKGFAGASSARSPMPSSWQQMKP